MNNLITKKSFSSVFENHSQEISRYILKLKERLELICEPNASKEFNHVFMSNTGFPNVYGARVAQDCSYSLRGVGRSYTGAFLEFKIQNDDTDWKIKIQILGLSIELEKVGAKEVRALYADTNFAILKTAKLYSISLRFFDEKGWYLCINNKLLARVSAGFSADGTTSEEMRFEQVSGESILLQMQTLSDNGANLFDCQALEESLAEEFCPTSPSYVLQWEQKAKFIYQCAQMCFVALELSKQKSDLIDCDTAGLIGRYVSLMTKTLFSWTHWRPGQALHPETGVWERNNWSNGYIPGALGLLYACEQLHPLKVYQHHFVSKGLRWLSSLRGVPGQHHRGFPTKEHWVNRSTNHGIVIYSTFLIGAKLLNMSNDQAILDLKTELMYVLRESHKDGYYSEGFTYSQFVILETILLFIIEWKASGLTWKDFVKRNYPFLIDLVETYLLAANSDGRFVTRFGDCSDKEFIYCVLRFLASLPSSNSQMVDLLAANDRKFLPGNELLPMVLSLPMNSANHEDCQHRVINRNFDAFRAFAYKNIRADGGGYSLWLLGGRLHKTHNKDYDIGHLFLEHNSKVILGELEGRALKNHSSWLPKGVNLANSKDEYSCYGSINPVSKKFIDRESQGVISFFENGAAVSIDNYIWDENGNHLIKKYSRSVKVVDREEVCFIIVVDEVVPRKLNTLSRQFIIPDVSGNERVETHSISFGDATLLVAEDTNQLNERKEGRSIKVLQDFSADIDLLTEAFVIVLSDAPNFKLSGKASDSWELLQNDRRVLKFSLGDKNEIVFK